MRNEKRATLWLKRSTSDGQMWTLTNVETPDSWAETDEQIAACDEDDPAPRPTFSHFSELRELLHCEGLGIITTIKAAVEKIKCPKRAQAPAMYELLETVLNGGGMASWVEDEIASVLAAARGETEGE